MIKQILSGQEAKDAILEGAKIMADAVGSTLGPRGANVSIERDWGTPHIIHDGVKVAAQIAGDGTFLENQWYNHSAKHVYKATKKTNEATGDGTTTAAVLAYSILAEGHKLVAAGYNSRILRRGILAAVEILEAELTKKATKLKTEEQKEQVATISAQDEKIGKAIAAAVKLVGDDGVITIDESKSDLSIEYKEGMQFDHGLMDFIWVTDPRRRECVLDNPAILITDQVISEVSQIEPFLEEAVGTHKKGQIVIIAKDVSGSAFMFLAQNKKVNKLNLVPVKAPGIGDEQEDYLGDIAQLVGAKFISQTAGDRLDEIEVTDLGSADRVIIGPTSTIIVGGHGPADDINSRVAGIDEQIKNPNITAYEKERLKERKSKLTGGLAIIYVGDDPERKEQVIDAISATKAAIDEGIVPGGETAYLRHRHVINKLEDDLTEEEFIGAEIVYRAVEAPFRILVESAGDDAGAMLKEVVNGENGYNALTRELSDLIEDGVIDPVKVSKAALHNAAQVATQLLTTNTLIGIKRKEEAI